MRNLPQKAIKRISAAILAFLSVASIFTAVIAASTALSAHTDLTGEGLFGAKAAFANSAQRYYEGVDSGGVAIRYKGGLVSVKSEELTFDIYNEQSKNYYPQGSNFGKVTAKYEFLNEGETAAKVGFLFPIGATAIYGVRRSFPESVVKRNGEEIPSTLRHSYYRKAYSENRSFDVTEAVKYLSDELVADEFYTPDLKVYKCDYAIKGIDYPDVKALRVDWSGRDVRTIMPTSGSLEKDGERAIVNIWLESEKVTIYFLGEPCADFTSLLSFFTKDYGKGSSEINASVTLIETKETTFGELVDGVRHLRKMTEVSANDWFNAVLYSSLAFSENTSGSHVVPSIERGLIDYTSLDVSGLLYRWYEYELDFAAGETVTNEVVAMLYPSADMYFEPAKYSFTYLLSPAKTWMSFENLTVKINTDMFLTDVNSSDDKKISVAAKSLVRTETGYEASFDKLPDGELVFTLCASENPEYRRWNEGWGTVGIILIVLMFVSGVVILAPIVTGVVLVVIYNKNRKKIREAEAAEKAKTENVTERVTENADETKDKAE